MTSTRQPPHRLAQAPAGTESSSGPAPGPGREAAQPPRRRRRANPSTSRLAGWAFLAPVTAYLLLFYAYPLYRNLDLSLRNYTVYTFVHGGAPFTGLANYRAIIADPTFAPALIHTLVFTGVSLAFQFVIGLALALFFTQHFRLSGVLRALFLVPWLLPLIVSASTWSWMLDSNSGIVNAALHAIGVGPVNWLTSPSWALPSVIIANIWIGVPFNLVLLHSGLQGIPGELYEAAALDGATEWQKFRHVTLPLLTPIIAVVMTFSVLFTFTDFQLIYVLTRGGPLNATHLMATLSFQRAIPGGNLGEGAALAMAMVPFLLAAILFSYFGLQRRAWQQGGGDK